MSFIDKIRVKVKIRTRLRNFKRNIRPRTRVREYFKERYNRRGLVLKKNVLDNPDGVILTLTGYFNYGNMLQRYALQRFLINHGHKFVSYELDEINTSHKKFDRLKNTIPFVEQRIVRKMPEKSDDYAAYITGSDQVWRKWGSDSGDDPMASVRYFFFDLVRNENAKRIAYAASFGHADIESARLNEEFMKTVEPLVKKMSAVSMREASGVDIVKKWWGVDADLVVDPTMLLNRKYYNKLIKYTTRGLKESTQIFAYILESSEFRDADLKSIYEAHGKSSETLYLKEERLLMPVEQWLKNIRDAELVITDSFHGAVFSIIFNTPFIVLENSAGGISRIESLLNELGLEDRFLSNQRISSYEPSVLENVDWTRVNSRLDSLRKNSAKWLLDSLDSEMM